MIKFKSKELNLLVESGKFVDDNSRDFVRGALGLKNKKVEATRHTILSGPPGVGKTYGTQDECIKGNVKFIKIDPGTTAIDLTIILACGVNSLKKDE
jgi:MoxR-like ATPase